MLVCTYIEYMNGCCMYQKTDVLLVTEDSEIVFSKEHDLLILFVKHIYLQNTPFCVYVLLQARLVAVNVPGSL